MPVGRCARHSLQLLQYMRAEKVIYANDMSEGSGSPTLTNRGNSPVWQVDNDATMNVRCDLKIPLDRVPNTPILMRLVWAPAAQDGTVLFRLAVLAAGIGTNITGAGGEYWMNPIAHEANLQGQTDVMTIQAVTLDGLDPSADLQILIERQGGHALDNNAGVAYIVKLILEYTSRDVLRSWL